MSSIGSATVSQQSFSPLKMLQTELASEVKAGTIGSADQSALSSALDDIDQAMQSSKPSAGSRPSPDEMKSKIDGLISNEVSSGKLTSDQADELKGVFAKAFQGGPGGAGGPPPGGAGGAGGAGGSKSSEETDPADSNGDGTVSAIEQAAYDATNKTSSDSTSSTSSGDSDVTKLLQNFLDSLKQSQSKNSTYGDGGNTLASKLEALIVNYQA